MTISYQLYSSRNFGPMPMTLPMLADLGYGAVEGFGGLFEGIEGVEGLRRHMDKIGIHMASTHIGLDQVEADPQGLIDLARALDIRTFYVPYLDPADRPDTAEGWQALGRRVADAGKPLQDAGLTYGWHNHDFEVTPLSDGSLPLEHLLGGNDLSLEMDLAWVVRGGQDPAALIGTYGARISGVHIKDIAPEGQNADEDGWADPGTGTMDWAALVAQLSALDVQHWVMEHDNPSDHERFAKAGMALARKLEGLPV